MNLKHCAWLITCDVHFFNFSYFIFFVFAFVMRYNDCVWIKKHNSSNSSKRKDFLSLQVNFIQYTSFCPILSKSISTLDFLKSVPVWRITGPRSTMRDIDKPVCTVFENHFKSFTILHAPNNIEQFYFQREKIRNYNFARAKIRLEFYYCTFFVSTILNFPRIFSAEVACQKCGKFKLV